MEAASGLLALPLALASKSATFLATEGLVAVPASVAMAMTGRDLSLPVDFGTALGLDAVLGAEATVVSTRRRPRQRCPVVLALGVFLELSGDFFPFKQKGAIES